MKFPFANRSTLAMRLRRVDKELSEVSSNIHSLSRKARKEGVELVPREGEYRPRGAPYFSVGSSVDYRDSTDTLSSGRGMVRESSPAERWQTRAEPGRMQRDAAGTAVAEAGGDDDDGRARTGKLLLRPQTDEQFATYFMAGGLERQGTLRQERHVQRNKAIFMIFVLLLILFAVLYFVAR